MSGLVGVWNGDGSPVDRSILASMADRIAHRGGDGLDFCIQGPVGMGCHLRRVVPESRTEHQPLSDDQGNVVLFDGRLDNRGELMAALNIARDGAMHSDTDLVLASLRRWGKTCPAHIVGEFAMAAFSPIGRQLLLARDPVGCRPLYYWTDGRNLVFASEAKALLAHPRISAEPNLDLLADSLVLKQLPYEDDGQSFFARIRRVLPGHLLVVTPDGIAEECFWDFNPAAQIRHRAYSDYVLTLRELLIRAIRRRMRSDYPVAIGASGGLDSTIVLGIADLESKSKVSRPSLLPLSYAPLSDERSQENEILALMEQYCGIRIDRVEMGRPGNFDHLADAAWHSETPFFDDSWCAETPLLAQASARGARVLLTGLWSDQLMFVTGYLVDLWKKLGWRKVLRHLREYPRWFGNIDPSYFYRRFCRELALGLTPQAMRSLLRLLYGRGAARNRAWVADELIRRARRPRPRIQHPRYANAHARNIYEVIHAKSHRLALDADEMMAARFGLVRTSPFLDRDVIAFLMAIPGETQTRGGVPRGLLRDAVRGLIPRQARLRRWRDEGTTSSRLERLRLGAYRGSDPGAFESESLGFTPSQHLTDEQYLEALGLEFWIRAYFGKEAGPRPRAIVGVRKTG